MKLADLKTQIGVAQFDFAFAKDQNDKTKRAIDESTNEPTLWLAHWDDNNRIRIAAHEDTLKKIKANPKMDNLALKGPEVKTSKESGKEYQLYYLIAYTEADYVL